MQCNHEVFSMNAAHCHTFSWHSAISPVTDTLDTQQIGRVAAGGLGTPQRLHVTRRS